MALRPAWWPGLGAGLLCWGRPAAAHGLGERYDLPLPLGLYLWGAAAVVALSFALLALSRGAPRGEGRSLGIVLLPLDRRWGGRFLAGLLRAAAAGLFVLIVAAGLFGSQDPFKNPAPVSVWILGWVGLAYVSALLGNLWRLINPWDSLFLAGRWLLGRLGLRRRRLYRYPAWLAAWPAAALFLGFAWMELVWPQRDRPAALAAAILAYSLATWTGMALFGRRRWLTSGEVFSVAFGLLARFAIFEVGTRGGRRVLRLRPPAVGLLVSGPVPPSLAAFALLMLSTVTFDGLLETPLWASLYEWAAGVSWLAGLSDGLGIALHDLLATLGLIALPLIFAGCFLAVAWLMVLCVGGEGAGRPSVGGLARLFVLTLVPIAIAYHLAHYLSYLLVAGQFIIPIASDPFGRGWNLFGTRLYLIDIGVVGARFVWYASLVLIVAGHVFAVWLSHLQGQRCGPLRRRLLASQLPMLALMVGYTATSLWILAQPIVKTGA